MDHATISIGNSNPEILEDFKGKTDDLIVLDVGAILDGYVSDTRRLAHLGKIPEELRELNRNMAEIVEETGEAFRPGRTFSEICAEVEARYMEHHRDPLFLKRRAFDRHPDRRGLAREGIHEKDGGKHGFQRGTVLAPETRYIRGDGRHLPSHRRGWEATLQDAPRSRGSKLDWNFLSQLCGFVAL